MDTLNYHHLRYFHAVAKEGGLAKAAVRLHVSQPSISAQVRALEEAMGVPLFRRSGRAKVLTDAGQVALAYAEDIFALGREMVSSLRGQVTGRALRLSVGVVDSFPKLLTKSVLAPVFAMPQPVSVVCREGKLEDLLAQLAAHRLDVLLADEPVPGSVRIRTFTHPLGACGVTFCATGPLGARLRRGFPRSLDGAPAMLPADNTGLRRSLEQWFREIRVRPQVIAEFEDPAMMKVVASDGRGFTVMPSQVVAEAVERYRFKVIGKTDRCTVRFYAITAERRLNHPAVLRIAGPAAGR